MVTRATVRTNQMGYYIKVTCKAQSPGIYGNINQPCPWAAPLDSVGLLP